MFAEVTGLGGKPARRLLEGRLWVDPHDRGPAFRTEGARQGPATGPDQNEKPPKNLVRGARVSYSNRTEGARQGPDRARFLTPDTCHQTPNMNARVDAPDTQGATDVVYRSGNLGSPSASEPNRCAAVAEHAHRRGVGPADTPTESGHASSTRTAAGPPVVWGRFNALRLTHQKGAKPLAWKRWKAAFTRARKLADDDDHLLRAWERLLIAPAESWWRQNRPGAKLAESFLRTKHLIGFLASVNEPETPTPTPTPTRTKRGDAYIPPEEWMDSDLHTKEYPDGFTPSDPRVSEHAGHEWADDRAQRRAVPPATGAL